ncbi:hypothetical protein [Cohnella herbarum]|uniref:Uncharacterized protein n=1 Tax=Cohnella herbarum TaxID=2728023 RepID=A0A7Z2VGV3_9BACL|nr:hypothetical protein [Cohnella herbarum]QJD82634.1 hypothetical protein HH215_05135 [Cohnella herbarum]
MESCYYHPAEASLLRCGHCDKPLCLRCNHRDYPVYCWSCGLDHGNGNLAKKPEPFRLSPQLYFLKRKSFIVTCAVLIVLLLVYGVYEVLQQTKAYRFKQKMIGIEFNGIHLFMDRSEIVNRYGMGRDPTVGCFGCEMNFIYPKLDVSGRYSETLGRSSLVKTMTTADSSDILFGFKAGDPMEKAAEILADQGFSQVAKDRTKYYFVRGLYYVQLWNDKYLNDFDKGKSVTEDNGMIGSITVGYRVKKDEEIQY